MDKTKKNSFHSPITKCQPRQSNKIRLARTVARIVGYEGRVVFDAARPDGTPKKLLDVSRLTGLGWQAGIGLEDGIAGTYRWYLEKGQGSE